MNDRSESPGDRRSATTIDDVFEEHARVLLASRMTLPPVLRRVANLARQRFAAGGKILLCGNGGSAADAQHFAAECICRLDADSRRPPLPALALTTDTSALTAISNDDGYANVFARQLVALGRPGDVLFALSTSGNSPNVVHAAEQALAIGCDVVAFTGEGGGRLAGLAGLWVAVPSTRVTRVQEIHGVCLHAIALELERIPDPAEDPSP